MFRKKRCFIKQGHWRPFLYSEILCFPYNYKVIPRRNDDPLNGISTRDILRIQSLCSW